MSATNPDRTENHGLSKSWCKSAGVVVLILAAVAMPCSTILLLKASSGTFRISPMLYGLWSALSLWIALDAAN